MTTTVNTQYGQLQGYQEQGLTIFRGIPYAQPPIGQLRFKAPQKPASWDGVREAKQFGCAAPQNKSLIADFDKMAEDCLYLNVMTPSADNKKRPVMFWVHGGSFMSGSGEQGLYTKGTLPKAADVVLVTINYRLGIFGFSNFSTLDESSNNTSNDTDCSDFDSNNGLRDMIAALNWVNNNIQNFGGDPNNITIFGWSAGAMSVACLLGSPVASGLFHKSIMQSGAAHTTCVPEDSKEVAEAFLKSAKVDKKDLHQLKTMPVEDLLLAQENMKTLKFGNEERSNRLAINSFPFMPCLGDDILPLDPLTEISNGLSKDIPIMVGTNLHEWNFFIYFGDQNKTQLDKAALLKVINSRIPGYAEEALSYYYDEQELAKAVDVFSAIESDRFFRIPAIRLIEAQLTHQAHCYSYLFTYEAELLDGKLGSCHAAELPFIFGSLEDNFAKLVLGESPEIKKLSDKCVEAWGNFARYGKPESTSLPDWPKYDTDLRPTLELGLECQLLKDPMGVQREFWEGLL